MSDYPFDKDFSDKQRNKQRNAINSNASVNLTPSELAEDFDNQLDYLIVSCEGVQQALHQMIWQIWKTSPTLVNLLEVQPSVPSFMQFMQSGGQTQVITDSAKALNAIKSMDFKSSLKFLLNIRSIRNLK